MKRYKSIPILGAFLLFSQFLFSQDITRHHVFSLEEIWQIAEANNRQLKLSALELQQSSVAVLEAKDRFIPELSIGGDAKVNSKFLMYDHGLFSSPQDVPVKGYGYGLGYNFNFNIFNGGKNRVNVKMKEEEKVRKQYEVDLQKYSVKYQIAIAYFDLYKYLHFRDFLAAEIATEKKQLSLIESLHKNGVVLKSDVLRTSVKLSQLALNLSGIEKKIDLATQRLNILMGHNSDTVLTIAYRKSTEVDVNADDDYTDYITIALQQSPAYKIVDSDKKWSKLHIKQTKAARLPSVSLFSHYNYTYPQISFYPYSNNLWGFGQTGVKVQFSIDNLYKSKHAIAHALVANSEAKEKVNIQIDEITVQVKEAYLEQQQAVESIATAQKNIVRNTEAVRVIRNSYLNQESLLTDLLDAENALLEANFNLTTAQANYKLSHIRLLAIVGML
ncbi:outer membrane protein TolC [Chitinophaga skermanii]|uniref:Outer membrane protein TolC n=1 Tax=Chitinophaga skermanii TaxID=331697 RepID=A0A327QXJ4_9BACT|nr:TolC family protein [Chitinophaga skermanii]RAJ08362.1 outer membrane protein TolC [Chitinophaga skermanii]